MKKTITILAAIALAVGLTQIFTTKSQDTQIKPEIVVAYSKWVQQHGRLYSTPQEKLYRMKVFSESYETIRQHQMNPSRSYELGLTKFADMSDEEFGAAYGISEAEKAEHDKKRKESIDYSEPIKQTVKQVPTKVDWRERGAIPPVRAQNSGCRRSGGAYTAAATATVQLNAKAISEAKPVYSELYSVQRILDCFTGGAAHKYRCGDLMWP
jgi:hypothetical protein